jgi:nucleoside-diphosphate-sugar epimerase
MNSGKKKLFCFGFGYVAAHLAKTLLEDPKQSWQIMGTTRDPIKRSQLKDKSYQSYLFEDAHPLIDPLYVLEGVTHLLISIPPKDDGDIVLQAHLEDILQIPTIEWIGVLSATSVYGDRAGASVSESDETKPTSKRGSRRAKMEEQWRKLVRLNELPVHIFRLAGIYGPGRSALDSINAGIARRILKDGHKFNRVHVADIVQTLIASMNKANPGAVYNVSDDDPAASHEVIAYAAELLGVPAPKIVDYDDANLPPMAKSFYDENKKVSNLKIKEELGVKLLYPDYKAGLKACLTDKNIDELFL